MPNIYALSYEAETLYNRLISAMDEDTGEVDIELANALAEKQEEFCRFRHKLRFRYPSA